MRGRAPFSAVPECPLLKLKSLASKIRSLNRNVNLQKPSKLVVVACVFSCGCTRLACAQC